MSYQGQKTLKGGVCDRAFFQAYRVISISSKRVTSILIFFQIIFFISY
jgi:hypothetical protein